MWWMCNKWIFLADFVTHTQRMYANCIQFILSKRTEYDAVLFTLLNFLFVMLIDVFISVYALIIDGNDIFLWCTFFDGFSIWCRLWIQFACRGYVNWQTFWIMHTIEGHEKSTLLNWNDCSRYLQWLIHFAWHVYNSRSDLKKKCREKSLFKETPLYCIKRKYSKHIFQKLLKTIQNPDLSTTSPILNNRILFSSDSIKFAEGLIRYFSIRLNSMILLIWIEWRTLQHWENLQRTTNSTVYNNVLFE